MAILKIGLYELECDDEDQKFIRSLYPKINFKFDGYYISINSFKDQKKYVDLGWILTKKCGIVRFKDGNKRNYRKDNIVIEEFEK